MITDKILQNEILVKMTSCRQHQIKEFTSKMKGLPNIVSTYCVLLCHDDFLMINESKQYCNLENIDKKLKTKEEYIRMLEKAKNYNYSVTLELMEYYRNGSIVSIDKINLTEFCSILLQLVFCQLNLFSFLGYTHNDIHPGNILIKKYKKPIMLEYNYIDKDCIDSNKQYKLLTDTEYILADYDMMFSFEYRYFEKTFDNIVDLDDVAEFNLYSLYGNILRTINLLADKLERDD
jgi:serine/threonine protein kinase